LLVGKRELRLEKFGVEPLDVDNYASWSVGMEALLINQEPRYTIQAPPHNLAVGPQPEHVVTAPRRWRLFYSS
jgi:hypothetical protein